MLLRIIRFSPILACALLLSCTTLAVAHGLTSISQETDRSGLFGSYETRSEQLAAFKKWTGMLARTKQEGKQDTVPDPYCRLSQNQKCMIDDWRELLTFLKEKPVETQIAEINIHMNKAPYITDIINWGVRDYWATLFQFMRKDGDCEDYAIAKYLSLKELGVDADLMRIAVVQDTNLNIPHAVLVVSVNGTRWVLDNQISYVVKEKAVLHYKPLYSINEKAWWLHRM